MLRNILFKLYNLLDNYFHPSFQECLRRVGILEDMRCTTEEIENLRRMLADYEESHGCGK